MMPTNFLNKLYKENKIKIMEPNEEIKDAYIQKSESNLISAKILLENNRLEESVSLAYYAMYNMLLALLFKVGIKSENHTGSIIILNGVFGIDNSEIIKAKKERIDKQYYVDFKINKSDTFSTFMNAEDFCKKVNNFISRLNKEDINRYLDKLKDILK